MKPFARSIVETVRHPLLVMDAGLAVVAANAPFYGTFGGSPAETEGRVLFEIDNGRWDRPLLRNLLGHVISLDASFAEVEIERETPGIGLQVMVLNGRRIARDDDGAPMVLLAIEDDTERRRIRGELRRLNRELEQRVADRTAELVKANRELEAANRELEVFSYSVSHDLRAPLRAVDGFSQELLQSYGDRLDEQGQHYLRRLRAASQRMGQLIDDLLKLSQLSRFEMRRERVDLTALAEAVAAECREREPGRKVEFAAQPGLVADCDPRLFRIVLENLIGNAWKFTAKKPSAAISFERVEVSGRSAFAVRDDGAGFEMAYAAKLFGAFQRLHAEREFPGTGIGLATVQRVVRRHGGEVWAEGAVGRGAAFYFTLPGSEEPA